MRDQTYKMSWLNEYWKALFTVTRTHEPRDIHTIDAIQSFVASLAVVTPCELFSERMKLFIKGDPSVIEILLKCKNCMYFMSNYPTVWDMLQKNPGGFLGECAKTGNLMFVWAFMFYCYWNSFSKYKESSFEMFNNMYNTKFITKEFWAHPIWFTIHYSAYHVKNMNKDWRKAYQAYIFSLQFVIPCSICRTHLNENLPKIPIDKYLDSPESIFKWGWELHNIVNIDTGKPSFSLADALLKYGPEDQFYVRQNARVRGVGSHGLM